MTRTHIVSKYASDNRGEVMLPCFIAFCSSINCVAIPQFTCLNSYARCSYVIIETNYMRNVLHLLQLQLCGRSSSI